MQIGELPASIAVEPEGLTIGRDPSSSLVLPAQRFPTVSGSHARLSVAAGELVVEDLGSRNGTLVNGEPVARRVLRHGDALQLGPDGPRFVALSSAGLERTVAVPRTAAGAGRGEHSIGDETMHLVRARLGLPAGKGLDQVLRRRSWRQGLLAAAVVALAGYAVHSVFRALRDQGRDMAASLERRAAELERDLERSLHENRAAVEAQRLAWEQHGARLDEARDAWESQRAALVAERARLEGSIRKIEEEERAAGGELLDLRGALEETRAELALYDPLSLEETRLATVGRVERAVVLIEARKTLVAESSGETLFIERPAPGQALSFNFEGAGVPFAQEGSGSGFCVSPQGWIITNAHVVFRLEDEQDDLLELGPGVKLVPRVDVSVVFTGQSERRPARVVRVANQDKEDLALIQVGPFEGMPYIEHFTLDTPEPRRGTDVFLLGFPLGKDVLMEGDTMLASTFRGIVSRSVDYYLQVDAAVHPGASGGPVIDGGGNVIGVVTGMQAVDPFATSSAIGYIIPVSEVGKIWPPPVEQGGEDG